MSDPARTPVLVGVSAVTQRHDDPTQAREAVELMADALSQAEADSGGRGLLARADSIRIPRGIWEYPDPARLVADRVGATRAKTQVAEIGVLQTSLFGGAARAIADGSADVVLIAGGEAKFRALRAQITGTEVPSTTQPEGTTPDEVLEPANDVITELEILRGVAMPVAQYAMIENALRHAAGTDVEAHRDDVAELWAGMNRVAQTNPLAWSPAPLDPAEIRNPSPKNRMLAFPYTKRHNSQWNVDQASGLILCSVAVARDAGVPEDRWIYPWVVADSNHMVPLSGRRHLHRSPGFAAAGRRALGHAGIGIDDIGPMELYSCFPAAVRMQIQELGVSRDRPVTVTGGMAFAGGPLNNFVLQAASRVMDALRRDRGRVGMLNAISGMITKQGISLWSTDAPPRDFAFADVTQDAAEGDSAIPVAADVSGDGTIVSYTVLFEGEQASSGVAICDVEGDRRTIATTTDQNVIQSMLTEEMCGRKVTLAGTSEIQTVS